MWPRGVSCLVAGVTTACLSSPPDAIRDGGVDIDAGDGGGAFGDCQPSPSYFGGAGGDIDGDLQDDLVLVSGEDGSGEIEVRLTQLDFARRCVALDHLMPRGVVIGDLSSELAGNEVLVLAFNGGGDRRGLLYSTEGEPRLVENIDMGSDPHFSIDERIDLVAAQGPLGWSLAYRGGHADVSSPFNAGDPAALEWHELSDSLGTPLADVLSVSLRLVGDDVLLFAATPVLVAWYDTSELPGSGPVDAEDDEDVTPPFEQAAFADLDPADGDECPDFLGVYLDGESGYKVIAWMDVVCEPKPIFGARDGFAPAVAQSADSILLMAAAQLDAGGQADLVFVVHSGEERIMHGMRNAHVDEVAGSECGAADAVVEACSDTGQELPTDLATDPVSAIPIDSDQDGVDEIFLVGDDAAVSCHEIVVGDWQTCPQ